MTIFWKRKKKGEEPVDSTASEAATVRISAWVPPTFGPLDWEALMHKSAATAEPSAAEHQAARQAAQ